MVAHDPESETPMRFRKTLIALAVIAAALAGTDAAGGDDSPKKNSRVNGNLEVPDKTRNPRNLSTVNGSIRVGWGSEAMNVKVVTGSIDLEDESRANNVSIVNGDITIGKGVRLRGQTKAVTGSVTSGEGTTFEKGISVVTGNVELGPKTNVKTGIAVVTGDVKLESNSDVAGAVRIVSGALSVNGPAEIGRAENVAGNMVFEKTTIEGDIKLKKSRGGNAATSTPDEIRLGPGTKVKGNVIAERPIKLLVHKDARIEGEIKGATAEPYGE